VYFSTSPYLCTLYAKGEVCLTLFIVNNKPNGCAQAKIFAAAFCKRYRILEFKGFDEYGRNK